MQYEKHLSEPWISHIESGRKKVEVRLSRSVFAQLLPADTVVWYNEDKRVLTRVLKVKRYGSFSELFEAEEMEAVIPGSGAQTVDEAVSVCRQYYSAEEEKEHGVLGIHLEVC